MIVKPLHIDSTPKKTVGKTLVQLVVGGAFGFCSMLAFDHFVGVKATLGHATAAQNVAFGLAMLFALMSVIVLVMSFSKKLLTYNKTSADMGADEFAEMQPMLRWSAICLLLYTVALFLMAIANPLSVTPQFGYFWGVAAAMVGQLLISVHLWRRYDELYRDVTKMACMITFSINEVVIFIWATAALCGYKIGFDPLAIVVTSMAIYWAVTIYFITKRGMAQ